MAAEDVLPKELDKLEITHTLPQIKLLDSNLPVEQNPFFHNDFKDNCTITKFEQNANEIKPAASFSTRSSAMQNCRRCCYRRALETFLDEFKHVPNILSQSVDTTRTPSTGVIKPTLKKGKSSPCGSGNRKVILREPVLKALQTCLHPHSNVRRKLLATATNTAVASNDGTMASHSMSDFRDLIDECRNLLSEDVDFSGRLNQMCLSNRNSKNFTTMQTPKIKNKPRNVNRVIINASTLPLPSPETAIMTAGSHETNSLSMAQTAQLGSNMSSTNLQQSSTSNLSAEQVSSFARCSTSCSQQAGNSAAAAVCDDVTIDELASYFDTFVHIPKKMSSMAEMMYI